MFLKSVVVFVTLFAFSLASDVLEIGDDDFSSRLAETETTLVMFYAPWYVLLISISIHFILFVNFRFAAVFRSLYFSLSRSPTPRSHFTNDFCVSVKLPNKVFDTSYRFCAYTNVSHSISLGV